VISISVKNIHLSKEEIISLKEFLARLINKYISRSNKQVIINISTMEKRYNNVEEFLLKRSSIRVEDIVDFLPSRLVIFPHSGRLRILAFSDYRVHSIDMVLEFVRNLKEKPDLIIYAGDDVRRFASPPRDFLKYKYNNLCEYPDEIFTDGYCFTLPSGRSVTADEYVIRLSWDFARSLSEQDVLNRIWRIKEFFDSLCDIEKKFYSRMGNNILEEFLAEVRSIVHKFGFRSILERRSRFLEDFAIYVLDDNTKTCVVRISVWIRNVCNNASTKLFALVHSAYKKLFRELKENIRIKILKLSSNPGKYVYYLVLVDRPEINVFKELAKYTTYGVLAVIGNDDRLAARMYIRGDKVYELQSTLVKIGNFSFVGLEGTTSDIGNVVYPESFVRLRLEFIKRFMGPNDKLIIVSHSPPRGLLDRAMRFGDRAIGSIALREFIDESDNVILVVCGHVHREGGKYIIHNSGAAIVNVSSHDSPMDKANIAIITIDQGKVQGVEFFKLPSPLEMVFAKGSLRDAFNFLVEKLHFSPRQADVIIEGYLKFGMEFIENLDKLANIKYKYGFTWDHIVDFYSLGVRSDNDLNEEIIKKLLEQPKCKFKQHLRRALTKFLRIKKAEKEIFLLEPLPFSLDAKIIVFDLEYLPGQPVLYGFYDLSSGEIKQFWFNETERLREYLKNRRDCIFVHWGGSDKRFIREIDPEINTVNLLFFVQIALVAPTDSSTLESIHNVLCGHKNDDWWEKHFYYADGLLKLMLCNKVLRNPEDVESKSILAEMNKADIIALGRIIKRLFELKVKRF